jgi:hypothetical protein
MSGLHDEPELGQSVGYPACVTCIIFGIHSAIFIASPLQAGGDLRRRHGAGGQA